MSGYATGKALSQLTLDNLGQWHLIAYFLKKMILAKTWYKTHNSEFLAKVKSFKTWRHYLKSCRFKILVLTNYNNLCRFRDTKKLSFKQVCWAQEPFKYYFWIDYCQSKANKTADALFCFPQRNKDQEKMLQVENTRILYYLQSSQTKTPY